MKEVTTYSLADAKKIGEDEIEKEYGDIVFPEMRSGRRAAGSCVSIYVPKSSWIAMENKGFRGRFAVRDVNKRNGETRYSQFEIIKSVEDKLPVRVILRMQGAKKGEPKNAEVSLINVSKATGYGEEYRVITIEYPNRPVDVVK